MSAIIAVGNQKGGVGKTTSTVSLAFRFASREMRVLVVDLDSQGHVAESFGTATGDGLFKMLVQEKPITMTVVNVRQNLDIVSNNHTGEDVKAFAMRSDFRAYLLSQALTAASAFYDLILLDMPPSSDVLHVSALVASDLLLIPAIMDHLALTGVMTIWKTARALTRYPNVTPPALAGVLPTMFERSTKETGENVKRLGEALGRMDMVLPPIPRDTRVREASAHGLTIWEYAPGSPAAVGYVNTGSAVLNSEGKVGGYLHLAEILETVIGH